MRSKGSLESKVQMQLTMCKGFGAFEVGKVPVFSLGLLAARPAM